MSDKILGIYIVASANDKEERYAKYLYSALESVCEKTITIEDDLDYKKDQQFQQSYKLFQMHSFYTHFLYFIFHKY